MKVFVFLTEAVGWLQIVASPFIAGLIMGTIVYVNKPDTTGLIIGLAIAVSGLVIGIVWATRVWKKQGTMRFLSRTMGTPELDREGD